MWEFYINEEGIEDTRQKGIRRVLEERSLWPEGGDRLLLELRRSFVLVAWQLKAAKSAFLALDVWSAGKREYAAAIAQGGGSVMSANGVALVLCALRRYTVYVAVTIAQKDVWIVPT
ncbi:hypothetical protein HOY82DRAFT_534820 [Tuber indicum]|nr:hypothetical protein HOY82DRAFT_534820 [Tuber indicum]